LPKDSEVECQDHKQGPEEQDGVAEPENQEPSLSWARRGVHFFAFNALAGVKAVEGEKMYLVTSGCLVPVSETQRAKDLNRKSRRQPGSLV